MHATGEYTIADLMEVFSVGPRRPPIFIIVGCYFPIGAAAAHDDADRLDATPISPRAV